jgi:glutaminyl-peptide cyclotransferase
MSLVPRCGALGVVVLALCLLAPPTATVAETRSAEATWSGDRAMKDIALQLSFGARALGAPGHEKAIAFIKRELAGAGASVALQEGETPGAERQRVVNIIGRFDPDNPKRIIVGTHYDSIIRAYADARNPKGPMPGANNSASGVALLLETARALQATSARPPLGVDLVFFDGEEGPLALGAGDPDWRALGSPFFVSRMNELFPAAKPTKAVIFDMVCYSKLVLRPEAFSLKFAPQETRKFWALGQQVSPAIFSTGATGPIADDQVALGQAGVPSILVIGFQYDPWFNTTEDTLDKCSAASLEAVGRTLIRYIYAD